MSRNPKNDTGITLMPDESNIYVWKGLLQVSQTDIPACYLPSIGGKGVLTWLAGRQPPSAVDSSLWQAQLKRLPHLCLPQNSNILSAILSVVPTSHIGCTQLQGPAGTPFESGTFELAISVPEAYPLVPPNIRYTTKIFHPNIHFKVWSTQTVGAVLCSTPDPLPALQCTGPVLSPQWLASM